MDQAAKSPKVKPIPDGPRISPYLMVTGAGRAIDFYVDVFGAVETLRMAEPSGRIGHAELMVGPSLIMLADEYPELSLVSPTTLGGTPVSLMIFVEDVDAVAARAVAAGAKLEGEIKNEFYGDRVARLVDPFGHRWFVHTHLEDVSPEELSRRAAAQSGG